MDPSIDEEAEAYRPSDDPTWSADIFAQHYPKMVYNKFIKYLPSEIIMLAQEYWNSVGSKKNFEDPLYLDKLAPFLTKDSRIVEYGCGYGRLLRIFKSEGYDNQVGFDFSAQMIERGKTENPDLDLQLLHENGKIPLEDQSADLLVMSTVLCTMIDKDEQQRLIEEIFRVLKGGGIFYLSDFLICHHPRYRERYQLGMKHFGEWGMYISNENLQVRHHTWAWIMKLLEKFDLLWFGQFDFKTMNQNPARTFHSVCQKLSTIP